jgi:uncharacterized membrane protein
MSPIGRNLKKIGPDAKEMFDVPLHPFLVHFPIALGVFAFFYDLWAMYSKRRQLHQTGYSLSLWAAGFAFAAAVTGLQLARLSDIGKGAITGHALFGISSAIVLAAIALIRYSAKARQTESDVRYSIVWLVVQGVGALLVVFAALTGPRI